jgi:Domain of unknown function (DUF4352)
MSSDPQMAPLPQQQHTSPAKKSNGLAVAGFVLALLGALISFIPLVNIFGGFLAFLGLIFGIIGLIKSRSRGAGKGLSIAAIVLAVAAFVISIVVNIAAAAVVDTAVKDIGAKANVPAVVTGKVGQSVKDGDFTFVVQSVKCGMKTSGGSLPSKPQGEFCAVNVSVSNHGKEAQMFDASQVEGFIGASKYAANSTASMMANPNTDTFLNNINPGNSIKAIVLIDVPVGKQLETVELHDSLLSDGTSVSVK